MITIFNRKQLTVDTNATEIYRIEDALHEAGIPSYLVKKVNRNAMKAVYRFGSAPTGQVPTVFHLYVRGKDKAKALQIAGLR